MTLWCGDSPLKEFPDLFLMSRDRDSSIADLLQFNNGMKHWDLHFSRSVQDWEVDSLGRFMDLIDSSSVLVKRDDKMCQKLNKSRGFEVLGYYRHLCPSNSSHFHGNLFGDLRSLLGLPSSLGVLCWGGF